MRAMFLICLLLISSSIRAQQTNLPIAQLSGSALVASQYTPVSVMQNGKEIALAATVPGNVLLVDTTTGQQQAELSSACRPLKTLRFLPDDQTLVGADDQRVCLWDVPSKKVIKYCPPSDVVPKIGSLIDFTFSADGQTLVTLYSTDALDREPHVMQGWKLPTGELEWTTYLPVKTRAGEFKLGLSQHGKLLVLFPRPVGATPETVTRIHIWDISQSSKGSLVASKRDQPLTIKGMDVRCVAIHPNDKQLVLAGKEAKRNFRLLTGPPERDVNGLLMFYNLETLQELRRSETGINNAMSTLLFNRSGSLLGGYENGLHQAAVWDANTLQVVAQAERSIKKLKSNWASWPDIMDARFTDENKLQLAITRNGLAGRWLLENHPPGKPVDPPLPEITATKSHSYPVTSFAFSADDKLLYSIDEVGLICVWDLASLQLKKSMATGYPDKHFTVRRGGLIPTLQWSRLKPTLSPDGTWLVRNGMGVHLLLTHLESGEHRKLPLEIVEQPQLDITMNAAFSPDSTLLVADWTDQKRYARAWETKTGKVLWTNTELPAGQMRIAFSPDGKQIIVHGAILHAATGALVKPLHRTGQSGRIVFSADGKLLICDEYRGICFIDHRSGTERLVMPINPNGTRASYVYGLPDARSILANHWISASPNPTTRVQWFELASQQPRFSYSIEDHRQHVLHTVSHDGKTMVASNGDHGIFVWNLQPALPSRVQPLTQQELLKDWETLRELSAEQAWKSMSQMLTDPSSTVRFLSENLKTQPYQARVVELIADLDHKDFARREQAGKELQSMGANIKPFLQKAAQSNSLEQSRRAKKLLETLPEFDLQQIRYIRAVEILERIGSNDAKALLERLAKGPEVDALAMEARQSLQRLSELKK